MARLEISKEWWSAPTESENGNTIIVTGRSGIENVKQTSKYNYLVEVTWRYDGDATGMPDVATSRLMEEVTDCLNESFEADPVALLVGIYTGDGARNLMFYCRSLHLFQRKFNEALARFDALPLEFDAWEDALWEEYARIKETEITGE